MSGLRSRINDFLLWQLLATLWLFAGASHTFYHD